MEILNERHDNTGRFYIEESGETLAEMDYQFPDENNLLIVHTEVNDMLAGKGIGRKLVESAVNYAREKSYIVTATCPFAKKVLDRSPEFADVYQKK